MRRLLRLPAVCAALGIGKSKVYFLIQRGLFPPGVLTGVMRSSGIPSSVGWLRSDNKSEDEIEQILEAWAAGWSEAEIKALVARIVAARKSAIAPEVNSKASSPAHPSTRTNYEHLHDAR
jgi:predicted DNA-binding transcriptional regulator AlpA